MAIVIDAGYKLATKIEALIQLAMLQQRLVETIEFGLESYQSEDDESAQKNNSNNNNNESENSIFQDRKVLQLSSNCYGTKPHTIPNRFHRLAHCRWCT